MHSFELLTPLHGSIKMNVLMLDMLVDEFIFKLKNFRDQGLAFYD